MMFACNSCVWFQEGNSRRRAGDTTFEKPDLQDRARTLRRPCNQPMRQNGNRGALYLTSVPVSSEIRHPPAAFFAQPGPPRKVSATKRKAPPEGGALRKIIRRRPTLPPPLEGSTIGAGGLNDRVRNGNGCNPSAIAAGKMSTTEQDDVDQALLPSTVGKKISPIKPHGLLVLVG